MNKDIKKTCIVELIVILVLSFALFVFNLTDLKLFALMIVGIGLIIYRLFNRKITISSNAEMVTKLFVLFS